MGAMSAIVETSDLTKCYGALTALGGCSLRVCGGEVFGLLGPNGAGKTTLLRLLLGFLRPSSGWARIHGLDCAERSVEVRHRVAYLPGEAHLFRQMRGREVLRFFADIRPGGDLREAVRLAEGLDLDTSRRVGYMSTGMRQKLALVVTLAAPVSLLILDEPTENLDPTVRTTVMQLVEEARARGRTVLFSSHVLSEVEQVCDRVAILRRGELAHIQTMSDLRRQHRIHAVIQGAFPPVPDQFIGQLQVRAEPHGRVLIETPGELSPLLGWLSTLALQEVRIEPVGLRAVYDRYHADGLRSASLAMDGQG
jgi:ABC-2 type transport system ATP-binding protein